MHVFSYILHHLMHQTLRGDANCAAGQAALGQDTAGANSGWACRATIACCQPPLGMTRLHVYGRGADAVVLHDENGTIRPRMTLTLPIILDRHHPTYRTTSLNSCLYNFARRHATVIAFCPPSFAGCYTAQQQEVSVRAIG